MRQAARTGLYFQIRQPRVVGIMEALPAPGVKLQGAQALIALPFRDIKPTRTHGCDLLLCVL